MTVVFPRVVPGTDQVLPASVPQPPEEDMTVVFRPVVPGTDQVLPASVPQPPEEDMTVVFRPLAWGATRDPIVVGAIPQRPPGFLSRPSLFAQLDRTGPGVSAVRVLTGMPGVGKTQLAAAYARGKLATGWRIVAWINAADTGSLLAGLAALADATGLSDYGSGRDTADLGQSVRRQLEADGEGCLLVFDNVEDPDVVRPFVPAKGAARVLLLITSLRPLITDLGISVPVDMFSWEETLAFLAERVGLAEESAAAVARELAPLPLSLAQAAAVMAGQRAGHRTYLKRLRALSARKYLAREEQQLPYPRGAAESALLAIEAVQADRPAGVCAGILEITAVLSTAGVRREMLHTAGQAGVLAKRRPRSRVSALVVDRVLARLAERSLLTMSLDGQIVIAHSLVMRVMRERLARQGRLTAVCRAAASVLGMRAGTLVNSRDRAAVQDITEQVTALQHNAVGSGAEADHELARMLLSLRFWALHHLSELGDSASQAIAAGEPLVADFEREFGADHPQTMDVRNRLALAYLAVGRHDEAIRLFEHILACQERPGGAGHREILTTQNSLADAYQAAGRADDAIRLYEPILAAREQLLGADHPDTLTTQNNLAAAYWDAGRADDAIQLFDQTLAARERLRGAGHPMTLNSRGHLAAAYKAAGCATEAIPLYEQALDTSERPLGADHPRTHGVTEVGRGSIMTLAAAAVSALATIAVTWVVIRGFSKPAAGAFFTAVSVFSILAAIATLGTNVGLTYFVARLRSLGQESRIATVERTAVIPVIVASLATATLMIMLAEPLAHLILRGHTGQAGVTSAAVAGALRALALMVPFSALLNTYLGTSRGYGDMRPSALLGQAGLTVGRLLGVLVAVAAGVSALLAPLWALPNLPLAVLAYLWARRIRRKHDAARTGAALHGGPPGRALAVPAPSATPRRANGTLTGLPQPRRSEAGLPDDIPFWSFTVPRAIANIASSILQQIDIVLVAILRGPAQAAIYTAATRFLVVGQMTATAINRASQSRFTELFTTGDLKGANAVYRLTTVWLILMLWPLFLLGVVYGPIALTIFGHSYRAGATVVVVLSLAALLSAACGQVDMVLITSGRSSWSLVNGLLAVGINIGLDLVLIPRYGILGAAIGWAVAIVVSNIMPLAQLAVVLRVHPFGRATFAACAVSAVSFGAVPALIRVVLGDSMLGLLVAVAAGCALQAVALWRFRRTLGLSSLPGLRRLHPSRRAAEAD